VGISNPPALSCVSYQKQTRKRRLFFVILKNRKEKEFYIRWENE
jgi:hypothetical protein